jgi:endonuclease YncB( thermonuclease family)
MCPAKPTKRIVLILAVACHCFVSANIEARFVARAQLSRQSPQTDSFSDRKWRIISKLKTPVHDIKVLDGRELLIAGVRCRLFGIRTPDDQSRRQLAKRFLELYVSSNGGYLNVHNIDWPLNDKDGVPLIWLANQGNVAWAQEALVQYGLAIVDYAGFEDYQFRSSGRNFVPEIDWKLCFQNAQTSYKAGTDANIQFNWPERRADNKWKRLAKLQVPVYGVRVLNGREILIANVRCRLFGIRLFDDEILQARAKRFLELYMRDYGGYFFIYNVASPISDVDGVPLIWLQGSGNGGWAQETLVEAGLAKVDYAGFDDYKFRVPGKEVAFPISDWKTRLHDAEGYYATGRKPHVNFKWPEQRSVRPRHN